MAQRTQIRLDVPFTCKARQEDVSVERCLDSFVEANAFGIKESPCYKCSQGQRIRNLIARS